MLAVLLPEILPRDRRQIRAVEMKLRLSGRQASALFWAAALAGLFILAIGIVLGAKQTGSGRVLLWIGALFISLWLLSVGLMGIHNLRRPSHQDSDYDSAGRVVDSNLVGRGPSKPAFFGEIDRRRYIAAMTAKWGEEAAVFKLKRMQNLRLLIVSVCVLFLVGAFGDLHRPAAKWIVAIAFVVAVFAVARTMMWWHKMNRAASEALGIAISWRWGSGPPRTPAAYERWCRNHGLTPYAASKREVRG